MRLFARVWLAAALLLAPMAMLRADEAADAAWKAEMERRMDLLSQELERRKLGPVSDPVYESKYGFAPAAAKVYHVDRGVSVGGYGEMVLQNWSSDRDDGMPSGRRNELDFLRAILYVGHKFTEKILFNSEIEFEHASTAGGAGARGEVSLEFAYLDFMPWKALGFRTGLVLVPLGIINEMHEPTVFHGARRPNVEQDIIPTTWRENGAGIFGTLGDFQYRVFAVTGLQGVRDNATGTGVTGFSAGTALRNGRSKGAKSIAEDTAWTGRVDYEGIPGAVVGIAGYSGNSGQDIVQAGQEIDGKVTLWDVHSSAEFRGLEVKGLYAKGTIDDVALLNAANALTGTGSIGEEFFGGYLELAYDVLPLFGCKQYLAPFARWERIDTQQSVPAGFTRNPANSRTEYTFGLTYKPHPNTVIKVDFQDVDNQAGTGIDKANAAVGYLF